MTNENPSPTQPTMAFGTQLKAARETLHLERKDIAAHLRLNEKMIGELENEHYPDDIPLTFLRGYLRSYAKFLEIPDAEVTKALEQVLPKTSTPNNSMTLTYVEPVTSSNYFMQFLTYAIILTVISLVGVWWYTHTRAPAPLEAPAIIAPASQLNLPALPPLTPLTASTPPSASPNPMPLSTMPRGQHALPMNNTHHPSQATAAAHERIPVVDAYADSEPDPNDSENTE